MHWIETNLVHGPGDFYGQPVRLMRWQKRWIYQLYRLDAATRERVIRKALLGLPKGNGKTELIAMVLLAEFAGPVAPTSPDIPILASSFEQADRLYGTAASMVREGPLKRYIDVFDIEMQLKETQGRMFRVAAVAGANDGGIPSTFGADEVHELTGKKARAHMVIANSLAKRSFGLELNISTAADTVDGLLGRMYEQGRKTESGEITGNPRFLFEWHEAPLARPVDGRLHTLDLDVEEDLVWAILNCNPAMEHLNDLGELEGWLQLENIMQRYYEIPRWEFERYHLNRFVKAEGNLFLPSTAWEQVPLKAPPPEGTPIVMGFDGSYNQDASALIGCTLEGHLFVLGIWERPDSAHKSWKVPREEVDAVVDRAMQRYRVVELACDPPGWNAEINAWARMYGDEIVIEFPTATLSRMAEVSGYFRPAVVRAENISHDGNPTLARHLGNCYAKDTRWGYVPVKEYQNTPRRIDAAVAAVVAYGRAMLHTEPESNDSIYNTQDLRVW